VSVNFPCCQDASRGKIQGIFIEIVAKIILLTKNDDYSNSQEKKIQVKDYEKQIDQMVYKLYGLTKEEIEVVEKTAEKLHRD